MYRLSRNARILNLLETEGSVQAWGSFYVSQIIVFSKGKQRNGLPAVAEFTKTLNKGLKQYRPQDYVVLY
jgi:hypothetical protein